MTFPLCLGWVVGNTWLPESLVQACHCIQPDSVCDGEWRTNSVQYMLMYLADKLLGWCSPHTSFSSSTDYWRSGDFQENVPMLATTSMMLPTFEMTFFCSSSALCSESTVVKSMFAIVIYFMHTYQICQLRSQIYPQKDFQVLRWFSLQIPLI